MQVSDDMNQARVLSWCVMCVFFSHRRKKARNVKHWKGLFWFSWIKENEASFLNPSSNVWNCFERGLFFTGLRNSLVNSCLFWRRVTCATQIHDWSLKSFCELSMWLRCFVAGGICFHHCTSYTQDVNVGQVKTAQSMLHGHTFSYVLVLRGCGIPGEILIGFLTG